MTKAVRVRVTGRVQGVFFRQSTKERADAAGVSGWVRNRDDGTVEMVLAGADDAVDDVLRWVRDGGPPAASVDAVDVDDASGDAVTDGGFRVTG